MGGGGGKLNDKHWNIIHIHIIIITTITITTDGSVGHSVGV